MNTPLSPVFWLACALGAANLVVSFMVIGSQFYSPVQKSAQCLIVWLVPILGAVGVWAFLRTQYNWKKYDTRAYPEPSQKMVVVDINNAIHDSFGDAGGDGGGD